MMRLRDLSLWASRSPYTLRVGIASECSAFILMDMCFTCLYA